MQKGRLFPYVCSREKKGKWTPGRLSGEGDVELGLEESIVGEGVRAF